MSRTLVGLLALLVVASPLALGIQGFPGQADAPTGDPVGFAHDVNDEGGGDDGGTAGPDTERAVFVGNNWEGTADVLQFDPDEGELSHVAPLDITPTSRNGSRRSRPIPSGWGTT